MPTFIAHLRGASPATARPAERPARCSWPSPSRPARRPRRRRRGTRPAPCRGRRGGPAPALIPCPSLASLPAYGRCRSARIAPDRPYWDRSGAPGGIDVAADHTLAIFAAELILLLLVGRLLGEGMNRIGQP